MKNVLLALTVLMSVSAHAESLDSGLTIQKYEAVSAEVNPAHVERPGKSSLEINYVAQTVTLKIERKWYCPPNAACALVMPKPLVVELPIVSVEEKECGIKEVTALVDHRPVDGNFVEIKVQDISQLTCRYYIQSEASFVTHSHTRGAPERYAKSEFTFEYIGEKGDGVTRQFQFANGRFEQGRPGLEIPVGGYVRINDKFVTLQVNVGLNCKPNRPCPRYMPQPINVKLPIVKIEKSFCGDLIVASLDRRDVDGALETIELNDYSNVQCRRFFPHKIELVHTREIHSDLENTTYKSKSVLNFN